MQSSVKRPLLIVQINQRCHWTSIKKSENFKRRERSDGRITPHSMDPLGRGEYLVLFHLIIEKIPMSGDYIVL